jgi:hypothetical protein
MSQPFLKTASSGFPAVVNLPDNSRASTEHRFRRSCLGFGTGRVECLRWAS